jgi:hypothetical protein
MCPVFEKEEKRGAALAFPRLLRRFCQYVLWILYSLRFVPLLSPFLYICNRQPVISLPGSPHETSP